MQLLEKFWYETLVPQIYDTCKVTFEMEDIFKKPVFIQYYEGCLMWIDIASYMEDQLLNRNNRAVPTDGNWYNRENFEWQAI